MKNGISLLLLLALACQPRESATDVDNGWTQLFNGRDLNGWTPKINGYAAGDNFGDTFYVEDSLLKVQYTAYDTFNARYGHLFHEKEYSYYLLGVEYRFKGAQANGGQDWAFRNSGAMVHSQPVSTMGLNQDFPISIEVQLLGGNGTDERSTANLCTPGTNVVLNGELFTDHCLNSSSKTYHGDQWVRMEALVLGDSMITHIVNGDTVLRYYKPQVGDGMVANFDPAAKVDGTLIKSGYISLQSESHPIEFRRVEIFDLAPYVNKPNELKAVLDKLRRRQRVGE